MMLANTQTVEKYYVSVKAQTNEMHSVHREGCPFMPDEEKRIYLGLFPSGNEAGIESRKYFYKSHGCRFCAKECFEDNTGRRHAEPIVPDMNSAFRFMN